MNKKLTLAQARELAANSMDTYTYPYNYIYEACASDAAFCTVDGLTSKEVEELQKEGFTVWLSASGAGQIYW